MKTDFGLSFGTFQKKKRDLTRIKQNSVANGKSLNILKFVLKAMGMKEYLQDPSLYKNLKDFIMLIAGVILLIIAVIYVFFIRQEQLAMQDFLIIIGYIFAFLGGKYSGKKVT